MKRHTILAVLLAVFPAFVTVHGSETGRVAGTLRVPSARSLSEGNGGLVAGHHISQDRADGTRRVPATFQAVNAFPAFAPAQSVPSQAGESPHAVDLRAAKLYQDSRPWTRWWWFASTITKADIADNLAWLKANGFGGVEIAWIYPLNRKQKDADHYTPRQKWLSPEWTEMVVYAKQHADELGLGCDFTFGSLWPFGDTEVPSGEATRNMIDPKWRQEITGTWDWPKKGYVIDHLNRNAFFHYAARTGRALQPALKGSLSGLFCDSWEVETKHLTTPGFAERFRERYGYSLNDYASSLYSNDEPYRSVRYDYMKLLSQYVIEEFFKPFTQKSHQLGAYSRAQCAGAPCDIISAFAAIDVPETEAILYEPAYANIVASAAALAGKRVVSCETFTCIYGWPADHQCEEQTADLKLLADAVFANGVNHVIWHGKPFNPAGQDTVKFFASVHVGKSGSLAAEMPAFNKYMEKVSSYMKQGTALSRVAVYMPTEDTWIAGELPIEKQFIWAWGAYEHRYTYLPEELKAWRPLWINGEFLTKAKCEDGRLQVGDLSFAALYIDVQYMDKSTLQRVVELAEQGLPVCLKRAPSEPGLYKTGHDVAVHSPESSRHTPCAVGPSERSQQHNRSRHTECAYYVSCQPVSAYSDDYQTLIARLKKSDHVKTSWDAMTGIPPLITGAERLDFWCRETGDALYVFLANPKSKNLKFPLEYGQSLNKQKESLTIAVNHRGKTIPAALQFDPYQSLLLRIDNDGKVSSIDISFTPKTPLYKARVKKGREKWEVEPTKR
jgi:hypothetical protein